VRSLGWADPFEEVGVARWDRLFRDLEAQLAAEEARELRAEVADRTRRERALVELRARLLANLGAAVAVRTPAAIYEGVLADAGADWLLLHAAGERPVLLPASAIRSLTGLRPGAQEPSLVARGLGLGAALRAISRDRAVVRLVDLEGQVLTGTIDAVGADHVEVAEHHADEPRRSANVRGSHVVPFDGLSAVVRVGSARS
jgi:hypothetical protein